MLKLYTRTMLVAIPLWVLYLLILPYLMTSGSTSANALGAGLLVGSILYGLFFLKYLYNYSKRLGGG
ncbi:hypothetical protein AVV32_gp19 [Pseudomonas phage PhiCHU]|uniref:Uncharacterized protein n=1 Tax=Pseudomonas phage PhiCHU TaxID=1589273 RepID=A0A0B4ZZ40_9CAUD|nr:hypothetical protein AVV32_gp19 [Pseudomonas phage PhiCHU]AJD82712.1 hypothetical protein PhiCHU_19 [Pseudomonas phage PhiCHU]